MPYTRTGDFDTSNGLVGIPSVPMLTGDRPVGDPKLNPPGSYALIPISGGRYGKFMAVNVGNGVFYVRYNVDNVQIRQMDVENVYRFVECAAGVSLTNFLIEDVHLYGAERSLVRLRGFSGPGKISRCTADLGGAKFEGDPFQVGIDLSESAHDIEIADVTIKNAVQTVTSGYANGDCFLAERGCKNIKFVRTYAAGATDGGYDLKGQFRLYSAQAENNKRNLRCWSHDGWADIFVSRRPWDCHINILAALPGQRTKLIIEKLIFECDPAHPERPLVRKNSPAADLIIRDWEAIGSIPPNQVIELAEMPGTVVNWGAKGRPPGIMK